MNPEFFSLWNQLSACLAYVTAGRLVLQLWQTIQQRLTRSVFAAFSARAWSLCFSTNINVALQLKVFFSPLIFQIFFWPRLVPVRVGYEGFYYISFILSKKLFEYFCCIVNYFKILLIKFFSVNRWTNTRSTSCHSRASTFCK